HTVTDEYWELSKVVMDVSQETRDSVEAELKVREAKQNLYRGKLEGVRAVAAENIQADAAIKRVSKSIARYLGTHGETPRGVVRRDTTNSRTRDHFDEALERLIAVSQIEVLADRPVTCSGR